MPSADAALAAVLLHDMVQSIRQLGVQSLRSTVVDVSSMTLQAGWAITESGDVSDQLGDLAPDSVFPGASASINQLGQLSPDQTLMRRLSPRRMAFAWRLDIDHAALCEAHFRDRRDALTETDTASIRLLCNTGIRAGLANASAGKMDSAELAWPQVDRRARPKLPRTLGLMSALASVAALLCAWLAVIALPQARESGSEQRAQIEQLHKLADSTMQQLLGKAVATGDYGEVQTELTQLASLGYFNSALVTNDKGRVVAWAGQQKNLRIGDAVNPDYAAQARSSDLSWGSERQGQLLVVSALPVATSTLGTAWWIAGLACAAAATLAGLLIARLRRRMG